MLSVKKTSRAALQFTMLSALASCGLFGGHSGGSSGNGNPPGTDDSAPGAPYLGGAVVGSVRLTPPGATSSTTDLGTSDTVACIDLKTGLATRLEVFEYYENQEFTPKPLTLGAPNSNPWERATKVAERLKTLDPALSKALTQSIADFSKGFRQLPSSKLMALPPIDTNVALPAGCFYLDAARVMPAAGSTSGALYVDSEIWNAMNSDQQVGLILHEALNRILKPAVIPESERGRYRGPVDGMRSAVGETSPLKFLRIEVVMTPPQFRQWHSGLVAADGFSTKKISQYIDEVRKLGQLFYESGGKEFLLNFELTFYGENPSLPQKGFVINNSGENSDLAAKTELFSTLTLNGVTMFHENGMLALTWTGHATSRSDNMPDRRAEYSKWKLKDGTVGYVADNVAFNDKGTLIGMDYGLFSSPIKIKTDSVDVTSTPIESIEDQILDENLRPIRASMHSFNFAPGQLLECKLCTGNLTLGQFELTLTLSGTRIHAWDDQKISNTGLTSLKLADGSLLEGVDAELSTTSVISATPRQNYDLICPNTTPQPISKIKFNESGSVSSFFNSTGGTVPVCSGYKIQKHI